MTQQKTHKVTATLKVIFERENMPPKWLESNLQNSLERLIGAGILTGHSEAEADEYDIMVVADAGPAEQKTPHHVVSATAHQVKATINVTYALNGVTPKWLEANLVDNLRHAIGDGLLTGSSDAYVHEYSVGVAAEAPESELTKNPQSIIATFQPQAWVGDNTINIDGVLYLDVTRKVLALNLAELHAITDDKESADDLIGIDDVSHQGPFTVTVESSICEYFGVSEVSDVSDEMLHAAKDQHTKGNTPISASPRLRDAGNGLRSALSGCLEQISQMASMFDDNDGAIAAAVEEAYAAKGKWREAEKAVDEKAPLLLADLDTSALTAELRRRGLAVSVWGPADLAQLFEECAESREIADLDDAQYDCLAASFMAHEGSSLEDALATHGNEYIEQRWRETRNERMNVFREQVSEKTAEDTDSSPSL